MEEQYPDQTRNLNPHAQAVFAMWLFGERYSRSGLGSMDFWDRLPDRDKNMCRAAVAQIKKRPNEAP